MRVPAVSGLCVLCVQYLCGYWLLLDFSSNVSSTLVGTGCCWTLRPMCPVPMWVLVVTGLCVLCVQYLCGYWLLLDFCLLCPVPMWVLVVTGLFPSVSSRYVSTVCCWTSRLLCPADMCVTFAWTLCILCLVDV